MVMVILLSLEDLKALFLLLLGVMVVVLAVMVKTSMRAEREPSVWLVLVLFCVSPISR